VAKASPVAEAANGKVVGTPTPAGSTYVEAGASQLALAMERRSVYLGKMYERLTAAAEVLDPAQNDGPMPNAVSRTWQHAVYGYSRVVPELGVAGIYVGNCMSRIQLKIGRRNPDGSVEQNVDADAPVGEGGIDPKIMALAELGLQELQSTRGGQGELLRSFGEKDFLCGEAYLVQQSTPMGNRYDCLSVNELMREGNQYKIYWGPGYSPQQLGADVKPIRIWRPDGQYGRVATSSVRSCIEILEELAILTRLVRASAISRMALSGILCISNEFDTPQNQAAADGNQSEERVPFFVDMVNTGAKAIDDPASAASWSPFLLVGPTNLIKDGVNYIKLAQDDNISIAHRDEALQRLAQGLDLPVEVILGHMSTTFANAAQINEDTFKLHIEPAAQRFTDATTVAHLWPYMADKMGVQPDTVAESGYPPEILSVAITYDATALVTKPDRAALVLDTFLKDPTQMSIRLAEVREVLGLNPDDVPDEVETSTRLDAKRLGNIKETVAAPPSDAAVGLSKAAAGGAVKPGQSEGAAAIEAGQTSGNQPAGGAPAPTSAAVTAAGERLAAMVAGAADLTLERAVEKVGAKLRSKARGPDATLVSTVENDHVAATLGAQKVQRILGRDVPAAAELRAFHQRVHTWAAESGIVGDPADKARAATQLVAQRLTERLFSTSTDGVPPAELAALLQGD
jgi:hypothetical protein